MQSARFTYSLVIIILLSSCGQEARREKIRHLINDTLDADAVVKGYGLVRETGDTSFVVDIFKNPFDPRITYAGPYKGATIYQMKMEAMRTLSGIEPPRDIIKRPDSVIINF